jgi:hypothetical protein
VNDDLAMWMEADGTEVAGALVRRWREIRESHQRYDRIVEYYRMYGDDYALAFDRVPLYRTLRNTLAQAIDAKVAELVQDVPRVTITLRDQSWRAHEQARMWGWYADATYEDHELEALVAQCVRDSSIGGLGAVVIVDEEDGPRPQRVHPMDVGVDDAGCMDIDPPELLIRWRYPRRWLMRRYPEMAEELREAAGCRDAGGKDVVEVFEGWYEGDDREDGRHVLAVDGVTAPLLDEDWEGRPPWARLAINPSPQGIWGISDIERGAPNQAERSMLSEKIQDGIYWHCPKLLVRQGMIPEGALDNTHEPVETVGDPGGPGIREVVMPAVHPEVYQREAALDANIYDDVGANKQFATGEVPDRLESGKAQRTAFVIRNRRLKRAIGEIQHFMRELMVEQVRGERRCYAKNPEHSVNVNVSGVRKNLAASALELDVGSLQIRAKTASSLGLDPASEFDELREMFGDGLIDLQEFWYRSSRLDLDGANDLETSHISVIHQHVDDILYEGKARHPERFIDPERAITIGTKKLMQAVCDGAPEERLRTLREWIDLCAAEKEAQIREAAELAALASPPMAPPAAPPTEAPMGPPPDMAQPGAPPNVDTGNIGGVMVQ